MSTPSPKTAASKGLGPIAPLANAPANPLPNPPLYVVEFEAPRIKRPKTFFWIGVCGVITAIPVLLGSTDVFNPAGPASAYRTFNQVFEIFDIPLNLLLLVGSIGVFYPGKPWVKPVMLWWAGIATIYETLQLLIAYFWIVPRTKLSDLGSDWSQLEGLFDTSWVTIFLNGQYVLYWISILSLTAWVYWAFRKPRYQYYFYANYASATPPVSQIPPPGRAA